LQPPTQDPSDDECPKEIPWAYARSWGSEFVRLTEAGHINVESGHGDWPLGLALLQVLLPAAASCLAIWNESGVPPPGLA